MGGGQLPKGIVFRNPEGAERRGQGGEGIDWAGCVSSDIRVFSIAGGSRATALEAEEQVETVTEGGWRFIAASRKVEIGAARHRQQKKDARRLGKLLSHMEA